MRIVRKADMAERGEWRERGIQYRMINRELGERRITRSHGDTIVSVT